MRYFRLAWLIVCAIFSSVASADDTSSVDAIIDAYYEVISGPIGFIYDAERDENVHAPAREHSHLAQHHK